MGGHSVIVFDIQNNIETKNLKAMKLNNFECINTKYSPKIQEGTQMKDNITMKNIHIYVFTAPSAQNMWSVET